MPTLAQAQLYAIYTRRGACYAIIVPTRDSQHTSRSCAHRLPLCAWADGPGCPCLPSQLLYTHCLSKGQAEGFSNAMRNNGPPSRLSAVRAPRIICLPKCMPATDHKHNHSLIVLIRLELEMPQCCLWLRKRTSTKFIWRKKNFLGFHVSGLQVDQDFRSMVYNLRFIFPYNSL